MWDWSRYPGRTPISEEIACKALAAICTRRLGLSKAESGTQRVVLVMPFVSKAQRGYFEANRGKFEKQGVNVGEWEAASKGKELPERAKKQDITQIRKPLREK